MPPPSAPEALFKSLAAAASGASSAFGRNNMHKSADSSTAPHWLHPCFIDGFGDAAGFLSPSMLLKAAQRKGSHSDALKLTSELLEATRASAYNQQVSDDAASASRAIRFAQEIAALMPPDVPQSQWGTKALAQLLRRLVAKLRDAQIGDCILVPISWAGAKHSNSSSGVRGAENPLLMFALHRRTACVWDLAVCTAFHGHDFHPRHRQVLQVDDDSFDPVLMILNIPSSSLVDSAPWLSIFRGLLEPFASAEQGARYLYEVLLPFFAERSLLDVVSACPPHPCLRRRASCTADCSTMGTVLEGVVGVLLLLNHSASRADTLRLALRLEWLNLVRRQSEQKLP